MNKIYMFLIVGIAIIIFGSGFVMAGIILSNNDLDKISDSPFTISDAEHLFAGEDKIEKYEEETTCVEGIDDKTGEPTYECTTTIINDIISLPIEQYAEITYVEDYGFYGEKDGKYYTVKDIEIINLLVKNIQDLKIRVGVLEKA